MAVDTAGKRYSFINFGRPPPSALIIPDGTIAASDRAHFLNLYSGISLSAVSPPVFTGTVDDIRVREKSGTYTYDYSGYFTGTVDSYSINPAIPTGYSFDTATGVLIVDSKYKGVFGGFVITATNTGGSDSTNSFTVSTFAGAASPKRVKQRKHKQVMIDGEVHVVNSPEEEFFLLQAFLDKTRNQYEADILKKKTPVVKKNIKLLATKINRTENRLKKVEEQLHWRRKLQREDEEILALLAA
jgi:hypothetical protein